jgi:OOP family OmpA-OmpF porin
MREMNPVIKLAAGCAALFAAALPLSAAAQYDLNQERGFYAGGTLGMNNDEESTWRLLGGYQVNRNFAAELGYHDLGQVNINGSPSGDTTAWELVGVGRIPINEQLAGYGKLGFYRGEAKGVGGDERTNDLTFGAGVEYAITRNVSARGEWQRYRDFGASSGRTTDVDVFTIGAVYRFR